MFMAVCSEACCDVLNATKPYMCFDPGIKSIIIIGSLDVTQTLHGSAGGGCSAIISRHIPDVKFSCRKNQYFGMHGNTVYLFK